MAEVVEVTMTMDMEDDMGDMMTMDMDEDIISIFTFHENHTFHTEYIFTFLMLE